VLATSKPWVTLRRTYAESMAALNDPLREVYVALVEDELASPDWLVKGQKTGFLDDPNLRKPWYSKSIVFDTTIWYIGCDRRPLASAQGLLINSRGAEALDCDNCGAPMRLVQGRDYFACDHCSSFYFPTENRDHLRVLGELTSLDCPLCRTPLVTASVAGGHAWHCRTCRGVLIDQATFAFVVRYLRSRTPGSPEPPRPLNRAELERETGCPNCGGRLDTHPYYGPGNVVVDVCPRCALIWLDYCELDSIVDAPGRDRR